MRIVNNRIIKSFFPCEYRMDSRKPPLEKTRICMYHMQGRCKYGKYCTFAHDKREMREAPVTLLKTKMCPSFYSRMCSNDSCNFAHSLNELRSRTPSETDSSSRSPMLSPATSHQSSSSDTIYFQALATLIEGLGSVEFDTPHSPLNFLLLLNYLTKHGNFFYL